MNFGSCWHPKDLEGVDENTSNETSVLKTLEPGRCLRHLGIIPRLIVMARLHPSLTSSMRGEIGGTGALLRRI